MHRFGILPAILALLLLTSSVRADGARLELVVLKDGSAYQGELVEKIVGDHVTIKLATGAIKQFSWSEVASSETTAARASPAESPGGPAPGHVAPPPVVSPATQELLAAASSQEPLPQATWPKPDRSPLPFEGHRLSVAVGSGFTTHDGYVLGSFAYEPFSWLGFEVGGGYGGAFGPTMHDEVRLGLPIGRVRIVVGIGDSLAFLMRGTSPASMYAGAPTIANFFDLVGGLDVRLFRGLTLRANVGPSWLANAGSYKALCPLHPADCVQYEGSRPSPWSVGALESDGKSPLFVTGHLDLGWAFSP